MDSAFVAWLIQKLNDNKILEVTVAHLSILATHCKKIFVL